MKFLKTFLIFFLVLGLLFAGISPITKVKAATPQQQLEDLQRQLDQIKSEKATLQSQLDNNNYTISGYNTKVSRLQGEAALYQKDIDELDIEIQQLQLTIKDLNTKISELEDEISQTETAVADLDLKSNIRIRNNYMNFRLYGNTDPGTSAIIINDINQYFKDSQYKELIQQDTNTLLVKLAELKQDLSSKKSELEDSLVQVEKDKELIDIKKADLDKKQEDVQSKLSAYYAEVGKLQAANQQSSSSLSNLNDQEMKLSAQAELIKQQIMVSAVSTGQYVVAGTIIGFQGCTGYCFGEHLHFSVYMNGYAVNPCSQLQPIAGCGANGNFLQPPLHGSVSFNSGFGWRSFDNSFHDGVDLTGFPLGAPVYAAMDGYVIRGLDCYHYNLGYASSCANYVKITQYNGNNQGYVLGYWHLR